MPIRATTTSFAILGLIAEHGCSPYELAKRMEINLAYFWPGARSHVFTEVKKLEALGYVAGQPDKRGKRARTRYRITRAGRTAMAAWLAEAPRTFALQMEGLVRVFLASQGRREDLLSALRSMRAEAETMLRLAGVLIPAYVAGRGPYPQHVHLRAIMIDLLANFAQLVHGWAERNIRIVEGWDDLALEGKTRWAYQLLSSLPQRLSTPDEQSKSVRRPRSEPVSVLRPARGRRIRPSQ